MADYRTRNRGNSIFSDDDRGDDRWRDEQPRGRSWRSEDYGWGGNPDRGRDPQRSAPDDRGFLERAGDEVRSWFGDEEAERRRERDTRQDGRDPGGDRLRHDRQQDQWTGRNATRDDGSRHERNQLRSNQPSRQPSGWSDDDQGGFGDGGFGGVSQAGGERGGEPRFTNHHDDSYRRWREEQIASLDREYDDYRSHRQKQFEQDFSTFRQSRQNQITRGGATLGQAGADESTQISTQPATGPSDQQGASDLTTGTETVTAETANESAGRATRNR